MSGHHASQKTPKMLGTPKFLALALESRMMFDAAVAATAEAVAVAATDKAPGVTATAEKPTVTLNDTVTTATVDLFSGVTVATDTSGTDSSLGTLVVTVDRSGSNQALVVDGTTITLENGATGATASKGYAYSVSTSGTTTTVTLVIAASEASTASDVATLIDGIAYKALDKTVESGTVTVTLKSLSDSTDTASLGISAAVTVDNDVNLPPTLVGTDAYQSVEKLTIADLGSAREVVYAADGEHLYVAGQNSISVFSVGTSGELTLIQTLSGITDMGAVTSMAISADGKSIYTVSGSATVVQLAVADDGTVSHAATIATGNGNASGNVTVSDDGTRVYVGTQYNGVVVYARDTTTGTLSSPTRLSNNDRNGVVVTSGDTIYAVYSLGTTLHPRSITVYQRSDDGAVATVAQLSLSGRSTVTDLSVSVSQDGRYLYLGDPVAGTVTVVKFDGSTLTTVQTLSVSGVSSSTLSADGSTLYVATSSGTVTVYTVASDGTLSAQGTTTSTGTTGADIAASQDGLSFVVVGGGITRETSVQSVIVGQATTFASGITLSDSNFDSLGNYAGGSLSVTTSVTGGTFGFDDGNGLTVSDGQVWQNGSAIADLTTTASGVTLTFKGDVTAVTANQVLHQLTYTAATAGSLMTLTVSASDGLLGSNTVVLTVRANTAPAVNSATAASYSLATATSETAYSVVLPDTLFSDADGDALTLSVSGLPTGLSFDPATRTISGSTIATGTFTVTISGTDVYGSSASVDLSLTVEQIANRAPTVTAEATSSLDSAVSGTAYTTTLPSTLFADADSVYADSTLSWSVSGLPDGLSFDPATRTISGTASALADYSVTVTVTDEHGQTASTQLTLRVITQAEADNRAPSIDGLDSTITYTADGTLSGYSRYVGGISLSADGTTLMILGSTGTNFGGTAYVSIYSRDTGTGELTLIQTFTQGAVDDGNASNGVEVNGLSASKAIVVSADGRTLYAAGSDSSGNTVILTLTLDSDSGIYAVSATTTLPAAAVKLELSVDGDTLYVMTATSLSTYAVGSDGGLSAVSSDTSHFTGALSLAISSDETVYVLSDGAVTVYRASDNGTLTYAGKLSRSDTALSWTDSAGQTSDAGTLGSSSELSGGFSSIAAGADGIVYVVTGSNNRLTVLDYDASANTISHVSSINPYSTLGNGSPWAVAVSADGSALYVGGSNGTMAIYAIGANGALTLQRTVAVGRPITTIEVAADGSDIYTGARYYNTGLSTTSADSSVTLSYAEGASIALGATALTLSDADYDALGTGGNYNGATITISRDGASSTADTFAFTSGNGLSVSDGKISLNGSEIGTFVTVDGVLTVTFTADVSTAVANQVLQGITYSNSSDSPGASITLTVTVRDQYTSDSVGVVLTVSESNDAPVVTATPATAAYSEDSDPLSLFASASVSTVESGQTITSLTFTVSGLADGASESLIVDGTSIALVAGSGTTSSGHAYTVTLSGTTATLVISSTAGLAAADAATLVGSVTYANSAAALTNGSRVVTLTEVRDSGGTANGGQDTTALTIAATVTVAQAAPDIGAETGSLSYNDLITAIADDGYTNLLDGIRDVVAVDDLVYVIRTTTVWDSGTFTEVPVSTLYVFQRAADGTLTLSQTIDSASVSALAGAAELSVSTDGTTVQVISDTGVALFSRTSDTGALTALGSIGADAIGDRGAITAVLAAGDKVYVTAGDSLLVFTLAQDGTLTLGQTLSDAGTAGVQLDGANSLVLSADGQWLVVGTSGGGTLASVFRVGTDGTLTFVSAALGPDATADQAYYTSALALSADGKTVYASEYDGSTYHLYVLSLDGNGTLASQSVLTLDEAVSDLIVSSDGAALFVVGTSEIKAYARSSDGSLTLLATTTSYGSYSLGDLKGACLSADGTQIYLAGTFSWNSGLMVLDLKPVASTYTEGGASVVLLPGATLSDPQLDAANNGAGDYNGASIVIERQGGAVSDDQFGFLAGDGLTFDSASGTIQLNGAAIATVTQSAGRLTITFTASVSTAEAQSVLRRVTYANSSDDPTATSSSAAFTVTLNDGTGHHDSMTADVTLIGVNDPPVITTTAQTPTYNAEGERVSLFKNTTIDTVEAGQSIWRVILTLDAVTANDVLGVDGGKINLDTVTSGTQSTGTGLSYSVSVVDGKTTVTLYLMKSASEAAALIDSLTYGNTGSALNGTRTVTLAVMEYADGNVNTTTVATAQAVVTLAAATAANTAPTVGGISPVSYTEQAAAILVAPAGTVVDAQMDAFNGGTGNYDGAVLTITLGKGRSGVDSLGFTAGNGLILENGRLSKDGVVIATVTNADGVLTITFTDANGTIPTTSDVQNTLRQITYADSSDTPAATVAVSITLSDQRGLVSSDATVSIAVTGINDAPAVTQDPVAASGTIDLSTIGSIEGLGTLTAAVVSADGTTVYVADGSGAIALLVRDASTGALTHVRTFATMTGGAGLSELVLSADGRSLYALRADGNALVWFAVDASGNLAHQQTIVDDYSVTDGNLWGVKDITVSEDGANLYLINGYNVVTFSRDPATGALTYVEAIVGSAWSAPYLWVPTEIVTRGDLVYVVTDPSFSSVLIVYTRGDDGSLSLLAHTQSGASALQDLQEITVSADGGTIYVAGASTISRFTLDAENGVLTYQGNVTTTQGVTDIALSGDGLTLYVTLEDGTLARYATSGDSLHLADSQTLAGAGAISTTSGGVIVLGSGLTSVQESAITPTYVIGQTPVTFATGYSLSDPELDAANSGNGEYQGASVTVSEADGQGSFGFASDSGLSLSGGTLSLNGTAIATVTSAGGTLTITFAAGVTTETANLVLHSLTYANQQATASTTATLTITLNDGQVSRAARTVGVSVIEINDAPTLSATAASGTIDTANGEAVTLFSDAAIDTVESGQSITSLTLVVAGVRDGAGEILVVDGTDIPLTSGSVRTTSGHTVTVVLVNGTASVTLSNTSGIAVADARTLVNAIAYKGADTATLTAGERTITLTSVRDSGGTVQGGVDTSALSITATVDVVYVNDAPSLVTTPATGASHTAGDRPVLLFGGTVIDAGEGDQAIRALSLTVSGLHGGDGDALVIDGTTVAMTSGTVTTAHGLTVTVTVSDGTATVTVSKAAGMTTTEAAALVDGIAYGSVPDGTIAAGQRIITLVSLQDTGGTADNGVDTSTLTISATVGIPDAAPVATTSGLSLTATPGSSFNVTLAETLFRHPNGDTLTWTVDGLPDGLSFDPLTRTISGITAASGSYAVTLTVTDGNGETAIVAVTLSVRVPTSDTAGPSPVLDTGPAVVVAPLPVSSPPPAGTVVEPAALPVGAMPTGAGRTDAAIAAAPLSFLLPVGEQFSTATSLVGDSAPPTSRQAAFDRQGDVWVATVATATATGTQVRVSIPAEIQGTAVTVKLANGLPLPAWVRFDRSTGQIIVDARQLSRLQQLRLQMQTRDANGVARDTVLEIRPEPKVTASGRTPDQTIASAETTIIPTPADPAPQAEPQPGLAMQLDAPSGLLEEARALLASLTGHRQVA